MLRLVLIGSLATLLVLTLLATGRKPMLCRPPAAVAPTARVETSHAAPAAPPPRYRAVIRAQPASPKPLPVERFMRGNTVKPLSPPMPLSPKPAAVAVAPAPPPSMPVTAVVPPAPLPKPSVPRQIITASPLPHSITPLPTPASPRANVELGRQLLGADGKREGNVPLISMDYRETLGWAGYVTEMEKVGGQFFLYDPAHERILARADLRNNQLTPVADRELRGLSPRLRQIEDEPAIAPLLAKGRNQFTVAGASLILLLPLEVDFEIVGGLVRALENRSGGNKPVARVAGNYERTPAGVQLRVTQLFAADGNGGACELLLPVPGQR
jgi:hypothetical protein